MYEVGGCVRDEILDVPTKDIDFTVVLEDKDFFPNALDQRSGSLNPFGIMVTNLKDRGFKVFLETPEYLTVRAKFPKGDKYGHLTADFVLARKEGEYADGRRPDMVTPGTLMDDLARRDFTMNAIAKEVDERGYVHYIDPFDGEKDIADKVIRAVGDPYDRLTEDALRAVRAMRFSVTKGFVIEASLERAMENWNVVDAVKDNISDERIAVEVQKMFRFDTIKSLNVLSKYPRLTEAMFAGKVNLDATLRQKGFGA